MNNIGSQEPPSTSQDLAEFSYPSTYVTTTRHRSKSTSQSPPARNATNPIPTGNISTADDQNSTTTRPAQDSYDRHHHSDHHHQHGHNPFGISSLLTPNTTLGEQTMDDQQSRPVRGGSEERGRERERVETDENVGNANGSAQSTESRLGASPYERHGQGHAEMGPPAGYAGNASSKDGNGNGNNGTGSSTAAQNQRPVEGGPSRAWDDVIDDAIDPILRAALDERSKEHAAAYPWDQGQARAEGQAQAQQRPEAMGINSLMDAEKQSQTQADSRGVVASNQNQSRRQEDPRRGGSYPSQGQGQGQGSSFFPRPNDGLGSNGNGNASGSLEDEYRRRESQSYAMQQQLQQQHYQQQNQQQSGTSSQGQGPPRPEVLRNAPPSLSLNHPLNSARSTNTTSESDVRAIGIQSPRDAYNRNQIQNSDHLGSGSGSGSLSVNVPNGYQELLNRGAGRFGTVAEQAAYRAGFEEAWEYRSKYMEDERARRVSLNMSTVPPTSSLRTTDNNPGPSPAKDDRVDLPSSRTVGDYAGYDGWERDSRDYARNGEWSAGQDRSYQIPGTVPAAPNDGYQSGYMTMGASQGAGYNSFRSEPSPMAGYSGHADGRQDRSSESMTPNSKNRKARVGDRQAISCNMCRQRKSKCDGNPPYPCGPCSKKGTEDQCMYATFVRRRGPAKKKEHGSGQGSNSPPHDGSYGMDGSHRGKPGSARKYDEQGGREDPKRVKN